MVLDGEIVLSHLSAVLDDMIQRIDRNNFSLFARHKLDKFNVINLCSLLILCNYLSMKIIIFIREISLHRENLRNYKFIARIFNNKIIIAKDINLYDKNLLIFIFIL